MTYATNYIHLSTVKEIGDIMKRHSTKLRHECGNSMDSDKSHALPSALLFVLLFVYFVCIFT